MKSLFLDNWKTISRGAMYMASQLLIEFLKGYVRGMDSYMWVILVANMLLAATVTLRAFLDQTPSREDKKNKIAESTAETTETKEK